MRLFVLQYVIEITKSTLNIQFDWGRKTYFMIKWAVSLISNTNILSKYYKNYSEKIK